MEILNVNKWRISREPRFKIQDNDGQFYTIENNSGHFSKIPKSIIESNEIDISSGEVLVSMDIYNKWVIEPLTKGVEDRFNKLFNQNCNLIFNNKEVVLSKPEYYYLTPRAIQSGSIYIGNFQLCLGTIIQSMIDKELYHLSEFDGHSNLFLIAVRGSILSGSHSSLLWCEDEKKIIESKEQLPSGFGESLMRLKNLNSLPIQSIDFSDKAIEQLLSEINKD